MRIPNLQSQKRRNPRKRVRNGDWRRDEAKAISEGTWGVGALNLMI